MRSVYLVEGIAQVDVREMVKPHRETAINRALDKAKQRLDAARGTDAKLAG
jgi:hypothetical protein